MGNQYQMNSVSVGSGVPLDANLIATILLQRVGSKATITCEEIDFARKQAPSISVLPNESSDDFTVEVGPGRG